MQPAKRRMGFLRMHGRLDDARRDGVRADASLRIFDGQRLRGRVQAALGQRGQHRRYAVDSVVDEARRNADHVAAAILFHLGNGELRDEKEAVEVHGGDVCVVFGRIAGEGLGDEDAGVVDERVDAAKAGNGFGNHALRGGRVADIACHGQDVGIFRGLDRTCGGDDAVVELAKRVDQFGADALRCARNDDDFL